jgi:hypothetical protein
MPLTLKSLSGPLTTFEKEGELNMTEEITDKMRELRASQKRTTGLAVLSLAAAGGLGYIFNLSPLLRPDLSENNVASYSERSVRQQISSQFEKTAVDFANFVIETGNKTDTTPYTVNLGTDVTVDRAQARTSAVAQIQRGAAETRTTGNVPAAGLAFIGLILAGSALRQNRGLKDPAP